MRSSRVTVPLSPAPGRTVKCGGWRRSDARGELRRPKTRRRTTVARKTDRPEIARFEIDGEWVSSLPFDRLPKGLTHLPLECVVYIPSTDGDRVIDASEFAARRDDAADMLSSLFGGCRESMAHGRYRSKDGEIVSEEVAVLTGFGDA